MAEIYKDEDVAFMLSKWRGGVAKIWGYAPSLSRLTVRVEKSAEVGNVHIICGGCKSIKGPFAWDECELAIEKGAEAEFVVFTDRKAGFELICEVISGRENVEPIYQIVQ